LDLTRRIEFGGETALQVSLGAEYRYENYVTKPLDVDSYRAGGYFYPTGPLAGRPAQVGAQGAIVVTPEDAANINRNIWAGYVDLALDVSPRFLVTAAGLSLSVDAYQIDLDDRITLTGLLSGTGIRNILIANGFSGDQSVRFFTNAVDTRTRGVDVVGTYAFDVGSAGRLRTSVGFNYNDTDIRKIAPNPSELAGLGLTLFD
ncbi:MAG: hypothetical protein ACT6QN_16785, partial [Aeromicrobium sp.]|uniref:hypothetical protein n=1 Tax=Aeromicrobium sp. TaxID=1871063 RepID=UPI0040379C96